MLDGMSLSVFKIFITSTAISTWTYQLLAVYILHTRQHC